MSNAFSIPSLRLFFWRHATHIHPGNITVGGSLLEEFKEANHGAYAPLSDEGRHQAEAARPIVESLGLDWIVHTGTTRTEQTTNIINVRLQRPVHKILDLRDQDWGPKWTGMKKWERERWLKLNQNPPGGETARQLHERILRGWQELFDFCADGKTVGLTGHDTDIKVLTKELGLQKLIPGNCEIFQLDFNPDKSPCVEFSKVSLADGALHAEPLNSNGQDAASAHIVPPNHWNSGSQIQQAL